MNEKGSFSLCHWGLYRVSVDPMLCSGMLARMRYILLLTAAATAPSLFAQTAPDAAEAAMIGSIDRGTAASVALLERIVNMNSGTMNLPGVVAVKDVLQPR